MNTAIELAKSQNIDGFDNALRGVIRKGNNFATITTTCLVKLSGGKKNPMQGRVYQVTEGLRIEIATDSVINSYEARYNRDLVKNGHEGTYKIKPHAYAVRYGKDTATMHHKTNGQPYMRYFKQRNQPNAVTYYTLDGERIDEALIEGLPVKKPSIMPETKGTKVEVERPFYRLIKVGSIDNSLDSLKADHTTISRDIWARAKA